MADLTLEVEQSHQDAPYQDGVPLEPDDTLDDLEDRELGDKPGHEFHGNQWTKVHILPTHDFYHGTGLEIAKRIKEEGLKPLSYDNKAYASRSESVALHYAVESAWNAPHVKEIAVVVIDAAASHLFRVDRVRPDAHVTSKTHVPAKYIKEVRVYDRNKGTGAAPVRVLEESQDLFIAISLSSLRALSSAVEPGDETDDELEDRELAFDENQARDKHGRWVNWGTTVKTGPDGVTYHGTISGSIQSIRKNGLKAKDSGKFYLELSKTGNVYITADAGLAAHYAEEAAFRFNMDGRYGTADVTPVVLKVRIPKSQRSKMSVDEKENIGREGKGIKFKGDIKPEWIKGIAKITTVEQEYPKIYPTAAQLKRRIANDPWGRTSPESFAIAGPTEKRTYIGEFKHLETAEDADTFFVPWVLVAGDDEDDIEDRGLSSAVDNRPIHRLADKRYPAFLAVLNKAFKAGRATVGEEVVDPDAAADAVTKVLRTYLPAIISGTMSAGGDLALSQIVAMRGLGEAAGHPFRGNQWTDSRQAISDYTYTGSDALNETLRNSDKLEPDDRKMVRHLDNAMHPITDKILYRAVNARDIRHTTEGSIITDRGYVSATRDKKTGQMYGNLMLTISIPAGSKGIDVNALGLGVRAEHEVILPRGSRFRITKSSAGEMHVEMLSMRGLGEAAGHPFRGNQWTDGRAVLELTDRMQKNAEAWQQKTGHTVDVMADRVTAIYSRSSAEDKRDGANWYPAAHAEAKRLSEKYGVSTDQAAGIIASLSPMREWTANLKDASNVLQQIATGTADPAVQKLLSANVEKAIEIAHGANPRDVLWRGEGFKVRSFYENVRDPNSREVTIDTHMLRIILNDNRIGPKDHGKYASNAGRYAAFRAAVIKAADKAKLSPTEFQAIVWVTQKREHPNRHEIGARLKAASAAVDSRTMSLLLDALRVVFSEAPLKALGEAAGHPFRGNQWTTGRAGLIDMESVLKDEVVSSTAHVAIRDAAADMMKASFDRNDPRESLLMIDMKTGKRLHSEEPVTGTIDEVRIPPEMDKAARALSGGPGTTPADVAVMHTHPSSGPPSTEDLAMQFQQNVARSIVVGANGTIYEIGIKRATLSYDRIAVQTALSVRRSEALRSAVDETDAHVEKTYGYKKGERTRADVVKEHPEVNSILKGYYHARYKKAWHDLAAQFPDIISFRIVMPKGHQ